MAEIGENEIMLSRIRILKGQIELAHTLIETCFIEIGELSYRLRQNDPERFPTVGLTYHEVGGQHPARDPNCVEQWPECFSGGYDPRCCRFPKSCSC